MKRSFATILAAVLVAALVLPAWAQKLDVGVQSTIVFQGLNQENDNGTLPELANGFQNAVGNLTFATEIFEGGEVNVDLFISSKHHTETWGYQGYFRMTQLPSWMKLGAFGAFYDEHLEVKAGQMTIDFGDGLLYRSINGDVYNNELIGNPVVSPALTTLGMEATGHSGIFHLMAGFSNGTTKGDIQQGHGTALHGKAWITPFNETARFAASFYRVDHSGNGTGYPGTGTKSYLFAQGDRAGTRYDVWNGPDGGQIFFGKEQQVTAFQLDGRLAYKPLLLYGAAGWYRDADCNGTVEGNDNGNPEDRWSYYMVTAKVNLTDWLYLASRYSTALASKVVDTDLDGKIERFQVGGGFKIYDGVLIKLEYVKQTTSGFPVGTVNNRTDLGLHPSFSGISVETAVKL